MTLRTISLSICLLALAAAPAGAQVTSDDISDEMYWTFFGDTGSVGDAGNLYDPTPAENPIADHASFEDPGRVAYLNSLPYYLSGIVAWGFSGLGRADILFNAPAASVSIGARGTLSETSTGPAAVFPFPPNTLLLNADASVAALDAAGDPIPGSEVGLSNFPYPDAMQAEVVFTPASVGAPIHGVAFFQDVDSPNAGVIVGGIGLTPAPEPGAPLLAGLGAVLLAGARRLRGRGRC